MEGQNGREVGERKKGGREERKKERKMRDRERKRKEERKRVLPGLQGSSAHLFCLFELIHPKLGPLEA